jgi:hypothetical protein
MTFFEPGTSYFANPPLPQLSERRLALGPGILRRVRILIHRNTLVEPGYIQLLVTPGADSNTAPVTYAQLARIGTQSTESVVFVGAPLPVVLESSTDAVDIRIVNFAYAGQFQATALLDFDDAAGTTSGMCCPATGASPADCPCTLEADGAPCSETLRSCSYNYDVVVECQRMVRCRCIETSTGLRLACMRRVR